MNELAFAQPAWLWGLLCLLPLVGLRVWSHLRGRGHLEGLVSPRLLRNLVNGGGQGQRWAVFLLHCLALAATFTALARPQFGYDEIETQTEARNLILAIDTSRSMLAEDLRPNRIARAKLAATDIVRALPEDRIGLIAFAGRPFLQAPLTVDHEAILEAIDQMDTEIIPRGGTNVAAAAQLALETFEEAKLEQSALVIFSDGEALEGLDLVEQVRERARRAGMSIIAVGVGTAGGAIIPELDNRGQPIPGQFVMDEDGQVVRSRLDPEALQALASGGGVYIHLGGQASLTRVVEQIQNGIATSRAESDARLRPIERFLWPLSFAVGCLVLAHLVPLLWIKPVNRSARALSSPSPAGASLLTAGLLLGSGLASAEDPIFSAHESFASGDYESAVATYEKALGEEDPPSPSDRTLLELGLGAAAYRQGDFEKATAAYGRALVGKDEQMREHAHYNLGNTLFRHGEAGLQGMPGAGGEEGQPVPASGVEATIERWESAIEHYESALALNESNRQAAHNIEIVKKRLDELRKQQEEQQQQEEEQQEQEEEKEDEEQEEEQQEEQEQEEENQDSQEEEQENEEQQPEGEDPSEEQDPSDSSGEENEESGDPEQPENGEQQPEDPNEPEDGEPESPEDGEPENQDPPENEEPGDPGDEPTPPEDGKLEADPEGEQPQAPPTAANPAEQAVNPETGYSPSEARQLLEALADETEVRPILAPARGERYKNW